MSCGIDACEIEANELLFDFLFGNSPDVVTFTFGFSFSNHFICPFLLRYVVLDEVFFSVLFESQSGV